MVNRGSFLVVFIVCLCGAFILNFFNIYLIKKYPTSAYHIAQNGITLWSPDNEYYLDPVDNYLAGKDWRRNPVLGNGSYYRRTPGYSILYFISAKSAGSNYENRYYVLVCFQLLLFCLSLYTVWKIIELLTPSVISRIIVTLIFGISPVLNSYIFLTVTESLFPHLIIYYLYWLIKASLHPYCNYNLKLKYYCIACLFICLSILTRPVTGILAIALLVSYASFVLNSTIRLKMLVIKSIWVILPGMILIGAWTVRNYYKTGDIVFLEVAFHPESHDRMKPEFRGLFNFTKCWGEDGATMNSWQLPLYHKAIWNNDTSVVYVKNALDTFPAYVVQYFGRKRIQDALLQYQQTVYSQKIYYDNKIPMPSSYSRSQMRTETLFNKMSKELSNEFPFNYYVKAPLVYLSRAIFNSNTSILYIFQEPFRHYKFLIILRLLFLFLNIVSYITIIFNILSFKKSFLKLSIFGIVPIVYLIFFAFYFKEIEQRYLLPVLIIAFLGLYNPISIIINFFQKGLLKKTR